MTPIKTAWPFAFASVLIIAGITSSCEAQHPQTRPSQHPATLNPKTLPGITIHRAQGYIDLEATVVLREGRWLELLACIPGSRTYESILTVLAKPSHIHLALLTINLEAGSPMRWHLKGEEYEFEPPQGPPVAVSIVTLQDDGTEIETPANQWVINKQTGQPPPDNTWLFTGSSLDPSHDPPRYRADVEGSVLSLVNFGDEVLARPTDRTSQNDQGMLTPRTDRIPPVGTHVKIRLRPVQNPTPTAPQPQ